MKGAYLSYVRLYSRKEIINLSSDAHQETNNGPSAAHRFQGRRRVRAYPPALAGAEIRREIGRVLGALMGQRRSRFVRPPTEAEVARAVAEFHARGGQVTLCPTAHAVPICNGAGRDAQRWTA